MLKGEEKKIYQRNYMREYMRKRRGLNRGLNKACIQPKERELPIVDTNWSEGFGVETRINNSHTKLEINLTQVDADGNVFYE